MDVEEFLSWWGNCQRSDIEGVLARLGTTSDSADGEIVRLRAGAAVGAELRRTGRRRWAGHVARHASRAVLAACERTGMLDDDRSASTLLARAAGEAARGLVAGAECACTDELVAPFRPPLSISPS